MKSKVAIIAVLIIVLMSLVMSEEVLAQTLTPTPTDTLTPVPCVDYAVSASAGPGGTIKPSGVGFFAYPGSSFNFLITPNEGYQILDVSDNGVSKGALQTYDLWDVQTSHQILATFSKINQTSTPTPNQSSSADPSGSQSAPSPSALSLPSEQSTLTDGQHIENSSNPSSYLYLIVAIAALLPVVVVVLIALKRRKKCE